MLKLSGSSRAAGRVAAIVAGALLVWGARGDTPVTAQASAEARSLFAFLEDTYGKKIISGQQEGWRGTNELGFELNHIREASGKLPALLAMDLSPYTRTRGGRPGRHTVAEHAIDWYGNRNGVVSLCWHWTAPLKERAFYTKDTSFRPGRAVTPGTAEHKAALRDIDLIAAELKLLQEAKVPVLWRPLHEANGRWFWWGADGPEAFKRLWRLMFERLSAHHKLGNLIWVFSPGAGIDLAAWYPGDAYVDIIGPDHYPMDGNNRPARDIFDEMVALTGGVKMVGFGENGPIPAPDQLLAQKAGWLFFIAWSGKTLTDLNSQDSIKMAYTHPHVLTLGDLPKLKEYPFSRPEEAVKLGFPGPLPDLAAGSPGRRPIVVAVQDQAGRTVRAGEHLVKLSLAQSAPGATLVGALTAKTVNGIAVFPDLAITRPGGPLTLRASAKSLASAESSPFRVGPGTGIVREWWTNAMPGSFAALSEAAQPCTSSEALGRALEAPFHLATNFTARYRGFVLPPMSGEYLFWLASESRCELWLSTDAEPRNKRKLAERIAGTPYAKWPHTNEAQSEPVRLEAGRRYYLELLQRQEGGSTHLSVRWRLPDGTEERPIPGNRLAALADFDGKKALVSGN